MPMVGAIATIRAAWHNHGDGHRNHDGNGLDAAKTKIEEAVIENQDGDNAYGWCNGQGSHDGQGYYENLKIVRDGYVHSTGKLNGHWHHDGDDQHHVR